MTELMDKINAFNAKEQSANPDCLNPTTCKFAVGVISCWQCAHIKSGGNAEDLYSHLKEAAPKAVKKDRVKKPKAEKAKRGESVKSGDEKFDMYLKALPKELQPKVLAEGLDPRALYKEYRTLKRDGLLKKYLP